MEILFWEGAQCDTAGDMSARSLYPSLAHAPSAGTPQSGNGRDLAQGALASMEQPWPDPPKNLPFVKHPL